MSDLLPGVGVHWGLRSDVKEVFDSFLILVIAIRVNQLLRTKGPAFPVISTE